MDLYTLYAAIRDGIAQDVELNAWAVSEFGKSFTIFSGLPADDFPDMDADAPFIALEDPEDDRGQDNKSIFYALAGWVGLTNDATKILVMDNVKEPQGVKQIIDALRLVRSAMAAALPDGVVMTGFSTAADTQGAHDEIQGYFEATYKEGPLPIGTNPLS